MKTFEELLAETNNNYPKAYALQMEQQQAESAEFAQTLHSYPLLENVFLALHALTGNNTQSRQVVMAIHAYVQDATREKVIG